MRSLQIVFLALLATAARADLVTELLPNYLVPDGYTTAEAINSSGWVVGTTCCSFDGAWFGTLWRPAGDKTAGGLVVGGNFAMEAFDIPDIHDNGDILVHAVTPGPFYGSCAEPPCETGGQYAVEHLLGGPVLSTHDEVSGFTLEWLSSVDLWGPIAPRSSNSSGQSFENFSFGPTPENAVLITAHPVPEPSTTLLLGAALLLAIGSGILRRRRSLS